MFRPVIFSFSSSKIISFSLFFSFFKIGTTLADTKTKYALYYSTCSVTSFRNGSIISIFVLGFTRYQNVTRLSSYLNRTLVGKTLFGGSIVSIKLNTNTSGNSTEDSDDDKPSSGKFIMTEQTTVNDQQEPSRTTYTTVTYTKLDTGLSITISETITITNANDKSPIHNKNYELILVPSIENTKTIVVPTGETNDRSTSSQISPPLPPPPPLLPPPPPPTTTAAAAATITTTRADKSPSHHQFLHPPRHAKESNFAYIDESSDDRTFSSGDGII